MTDTLSHASDVGPIQSCSRCNTSMQATQLPCTFCVGCGGMLTTHRDPNVSVADAMQSVVATLARFHDQRARNAEARQVDLQRQCDELSRQTVVLEAQTEALRRLLRQFTQADSSLAAQSTYHGQAASIGAAQSRPLHTAQSKPPVPCLAASMGTRAASSPPSPRGTTVKPSLPPACFFSMTVSTPTSRSVAPPAVIQPEDVARCLRAPAAPSASHQPLLDHL